MTRHTSLANLGINDAVLRDLDLVDSCSQLGALASAQSKFDSMFGPESELGKARSAHELMFGPESTLGQIRSMHESLFGPESALGKARTAHESLFGPESALGKARSTHELMFGPESALGKACSTHELMFGPESALGQMRSTHELMFGPESALGKARSTHELMFGPESALGQMRSMHDSLFGPESELGKARSAHELMFGPESELGKARSAHELMFGRVSALAKVTAGYTSMFDESALAKATSMFGMDALSRTHSVYGSVLDETTAFAKVWNSQSVGSLFSETWLATAPPSYGALLGESAVPTITGALRFGFHDAMEETLLRAAISDVYRSGVPGPLSYGFDAAALYRRGLDAFLTSSTEFPTPAALATGRSGPTAPAKLSVVRTGEPERLERTVHADLDVNVADDTSATSDPSTVTTDLALPDHLAIAVVSYCVENRITMGRLVQELLAGFFELDPDKPPPPPTVRHLKLVK